MSAVVACGSHTMHTAALQLPLRYGAMQALSKLLKPVAAPVRSGQVRLAWGCAGMTDDSNTSLLDTSAFLVGPFMLNCTQ